MTIPILAGLALLAPPVQTGGWTPAKFSADDLARRIDARLASLTKTTLVYKYVYDKAAVGHAEAICEAHIGGPKRFWIQVPQLDPRQSRAPFNQEVWRANGKNFGRAVLPKDPLPGSFAGRPGVPVKTVNAWFTDFSRVILAGVGQPVRPLERLVDDARRQGFKMAVQTRTFAYRGRNVSSQRLVLAKGPARYEIVVDAKGALPVAITNTVGKDATRWIMVDWNLRPGKHLNPLNFEFTKAGEVRDIAPGPRRS